MQWCCRHLLDVFWQLASRVENVLCLALHFEPLKDCLSQSAIEKQRAKWLKRDVFSAPLTWLGQAQKGTLMKLYIMELRQKLDTYKMQVNTSQNLSYS